MVGREFGAVRKERRPRMCPRRGQRVAIYIAEITSLKDHTVCDAVQSDSTSEAYGSLLCLLLDEIQKCEIIFLENCLHRGCQVRMLLEDFGARDSWLAEDFAHCVGENRSERRRPTFPSDVEACAW